MVDLDEKEQHHQNHQSKPSSSSSQQQQSMARDERAKRIESDDQEEEQIMEKAKIEKEKIVKPKPIFLGRHRISAAISQLNTQITVIQEELNELEKVGQSSIVCKELISSLETIPDPLLPTTNGPTDVIWDRWFRGAHDDSKSHKRWI